MCLDPFGDQLIFETRETVYMYIMGPVVSCAIQEGCEYNCFRTSCPNPVGKKIHIFVKFHVTFRLMLTKY